MDEVIETTATDYDISPDVEFIDLECSINDDGEALYRHVIVTGWQVVPSR